MSSSYELLEQIADLADRSTGWVKANLRLSNYTHVDQATKRQIALLLQRYAELLNKQRR